MLIIIDTLTMNFKTYFQESIKANGDLKKTLGKIPKAHRKLAAGYKFVYQDGNALKGDTENIGETDKDKKIITVSAPWNYGREYTTLHEIAHLVWESLMCRKLRKQWQTIIQQTKHKQNQGGEELFCMAYANTYAKNKIEIHTHSSWERFIHNLPR